MRKVTLMLLMLIGLASVTSGCRVEGEVGESSHIPSVNVSSNVM